METAMDAVYSKAEFYWGREPNDLCRQVLEYVTPEQARGRLLLDLGSGEGRDAIHFARHGFEVVALDLSRPGLEKAQRWAEEEGLRLQILQANLLSYRLDRPFHVLYSSGALHYLPKSLRAEVFANYKAQTRVGGLHAFNVFVEKPFLSVPPDYTPEEYFFRSGELLGYYWDWEILFCSEIIFDCNSSGIPHRHAMDVMIARKVIE
ncbi:MAG: hypothetical protein KatS3mg057_2934 [Herpetosiphonaceae bacterium]|nr:MAG: hypothetical protein KatS3mg057_2934 [Herpetosiphonaceae bacterium]